MNQEKKKSKSMAGRLPDEIIEDILTRLPLKTLSNCRWVSKSWYDFILTSKFAHRHFSKHQHDSLSAIFPDRFGRSCLIDPEGLSNHETSVIGFDLVFKNFRENFKIRSLRGRSFEVIGTVNGLVAFAAEREDEYVYVSAPYYIVNPITLDYLLVQKSTVEPIGFGFGFDQIKKEYKVVHILPKSSLPRGLHRSLYGNRVEVYTLGSGSGWREIQLPPCNIYSMKQFNVLLHGCLYGMSQIGTEHGQTGQIISFDVAREEFSQPPMPPCDRWIFDTCDLVVLNECLCVLEGWFLGDNEKRIWAMKTDGLWVQEYVFKPKVYNCSWYGYHEVMGQKTNNLLLVDKKGNLMYYDHRVRIYEPITLHNLGGNKILVKPDFPVYVKGSLFSPTAIDNGQRA